MERTSLNDDKRHDRLMTRTLWLNTRVIALSTGLVCGTLLFMATNWLVIKGGSPVGPHLRLLGQFFWGYEVTFTGSLLGFCYGLVTGAACGGGIGWIYNTIVLHRQRQSNECPQ